MNCPKCHRPVTTVSERGVDFEHCRRCGGMWFDRGEMLRYINDMLEKDSDAIPVPDYVPMPKKVMLPPDGEYACPRCRTPLRVRNYGYDSNVLVDVCEQCKGVWLDRDEVRTIAGYIRGNPMANELAESFREDFQRKPEFEVAPAAGFILGVADSAPLSIVPWFTLALIVINIGVFALQMYITASMGEAAWLSYALVPETILSGARLETIVTSMFLHASIAHVLFNMWFLWVFGDNVEEEFGHGVFILFYVVSGLAGTALYVATHASSTMPCLGASGAVSGVLGAYMVFHPTERIHTRVLYRPVELPAAIFLGFWIMYQILGSVMELNASSAGGVAWLAHVGGFLAGVVVAMLYRSVWLPRRAPESSIVK